MPELREALADYLNRVRRAAVDPDNVVIGNGFAQGIRLIIEVLPRSGARRLAVEDPSADDDARLMVGRHRDRGRRCPGRPGRHPDRPAGRHRRRRCRADPVTLENRVRLFDLPVQMPQHTTCRLRPKAPDVSDWAGARLTCAPQSWASSSGTTPARFVRPAVSLRYGRLTAGNT